MISLLTGEYYNTLDDKGRVSIPARLRERLPGSVLHVTRGTHCCLWAFTPEEWEQSAARWLGSTQTAKRRSEILHRFIGPMQEVEIDKAGRIMVPPSLRDYARLSKDCVVIGIGKTMEIWDLEQHRIFDESLGSDFNEVLEDISSLDFYG